MPRSPTVRGGYSDSPSSPLPTIPSPRQTGPKQRDTDCWQWGLLLGWTKESWGGGECQQDERRRWPCVYTCLLPSPASLGLLRRPSDERQPDLGQGREGSHLRQEIQTSRGRTKVKQTSAGQLTSAGRECAHTSNSNSSGVPQSVHLVRGLSHSWNLTH